MLPLHRVLLALMCALLGSLTGSLATAEQLTVAVAANFTPTARQLAPLFEAQTGVRVVLVSGSTGKHYAQIRNGAPFDLLLAADARTPLALEDAGLADNRFTYAVGRLVLWQRQPVQPDSKRRPPGAHTLIEAPFSRLAIANPRLAPYGEAAQSALQALGVWQAVRAKLVRGENINQAFQFVLTGAADAGLIALAQVQDIAEEELWLVPESLHSPIIQQAVVLRPSCAATQFTAFLHTSAAREVIHRYGYETPDAPLERQNAACSLAEQDRKQRSAQ